MTFFKAVILGVFIAIGAAECAATDNNNLCADWKINDCVAENTNTNGCVFHDKVQQCVNQFLDACQGHFRVIADEEININKAQKAACPGLPDGQCYFGRLSECMAILTRPDSLYDDAKTSTAEECKSFEESAKLARDCLDKLRAACLFADVGPSVKTIDEDERKICGHD